METSGGSVVQEMRRVLLKIDLDHASDFSLYVVFYPKVYICNRYADNGEIAAIIKHKVEDGKMRVILECGDIVCNSTYVKM